MSMTNHAAGIGTCVQGMTIPSYLSSEMHLQKNPWPNEISELDREFPSWRLREKRRISRSYCSGSRARSNQLAEDLLNLKSITGKDFSDYEELDLMMAAELKWCYYIAHLIYEITERWAVTRQKGRKTLAPSGGRQLDFVQKETLAVFSTRMPRDAVRLCGKKWQTQEISPGKGILFSTEKRKNRLTWKAQTVWRPVLRLEFKNPLSVAVEMKKIVMWLSTSSRVSWLQVPKQMHLWPSLPISTWWRWKETSVRVRKEEGTQGAVAIMRKKKRPRLCIWRLRSNEFFSTESWRIGIERFGGTHHEILGMHLVRIKIRERKGQSEWIIQKGEPHERNPCALSFEERTLEETSRQADCDSKVAWNLSRKCTMLSEGDLSSDKMDTLRRRSRNHMTVLTANRKVQINEDAQILFTISVCS